MGAVHSGQRSGVPRVSVVIPTFNRARLTTEAVASVCDQTVGDVEIIVVDDGSVDETRDCIRRQAESDRRIRYVRTDHSGFPGRARNIGVEVAHAECIAFLDSDDLWLPRKLERQLPLLHRGTYRICHTGERWLRNGHEVSQSKRRHRRHGDLFAGSLVKCIIGPSTVLLERSLFDEVGGFREDIEVCEDYELWLRLTAYHEVCYLDEPLTIKRAGHDDQLSEKYGQIEIFRITALADLLAGGFLMPSTHESPQDTAPAAGANTDTATDTGTSSQLHAPSGNHERTAELRWTAELERMAERRTVAEQELARKCRIYAVGARKRGRLEEARRFEALAEEAVGGRLSPAIYSKGLLPIRDLSRAHGEDSMI